MPRILLLLITTVSLSQAVVGKNISREEFLNTIQAKGCFNKEELKCLGVTTNQCEDYMQTVVTECKDHLPDTLDLNNLIAQEKAIDNFSNCANKLSQSVLGVSPDKAASCGAR